MAFFTMEFNGSKIHLQVDFGYIFTFFGAEVGLVANKFWQETGVPALHPG